jgi:short subunit dehydrogenase-like uncharacterized protein
MTKDGSPAEFDLVVYGATGYTGRLVADHLARRQAAGESIRWAMSGRSLDRLAAVRDEIQAPSSIPLLHAEANNPASLRDLVGRTRCVLSTVGPYQLYGSDLVAACAETGTDYVDLCGEALWMRQMIEAHHTQAVASGARILFACGFDSLPSELGTWLCQQAAQDLFGAPVARVKGRVRRFIGGLSGGTFATITAMTRAVEADPSLVELLADPFALTPGFKGPVQPPASEPEDDPDVGPVVPFMLGPANRMNVHRSNLLMGHPYGADFVYDEMALAGALAAPAHASPPAPGDGPSEEQRNNGSFDLLFIGTAADGRQVRVSVSGDKDPGYGSTSQMMAETAICLVSSPQVAGGIWTPVAALQERLRDQLATHTGVSVSLKT